MTQTRSTSRQGKAKGWHQVFAQVAAAYEHSMREPRSWQGLSRHQAAYLLCLKVQGYRLSDVEELAVAKHIPQPDDEDQAGFVGSNEHRLLVSLGSA